MNIVNAVTSDTSTEINSRKINTKWQTKWKLIGKKEAIRVEIWPSNNIKKSNNTGIPTCCLKNRISVPHQSYHTNVRKISTWFNIYFFCQIVTT